MADTVTVQFLGNARALNTVIGRVDQRLGNLARLATRVGVALGVAAAAGATTAVKGFVEFDQQMTNSLAIMGDVTDTMRNDLKQGAIEVGKTTTISASEAAEAYFFLASAGLTAAESLQALPQVAAFAQAGNFDMAVATDLVTDAQSALGLASDNTAENLGNLTRITDVLVNANTLANASVEEFSAALTNDAASSLRVANKSIEEGVAVLAAWADQGTRGRRAGTALGIVMRDLKIKSVENKAAFDQLGISVFDSKGEMNNMADIIDDLTNAFGHLDPEAATEALGDLGFSQDNLKRLEQLLGTGDQIREFEAALMNSAGTTNDVAAKQLEAIRAQWDLLKGSVEATSLIIVDKFGPDIINTLESIRLWWEANSPKIVDFFDRSFVRMSDWWDARGSQVMDLIRAALVLLGGTARLAFGVISDWWSQHGDQVLDTLHTRLQAALGFLSDWWSANREPILDFLTRFRDGVQDSFERFSGWVENKGPEIVGFFQELRKKGRKALDRISEWWEDHGTNVLGFLGDLRDGFDEAFSLLQEWWEENGDTVIQAFDDLAEIFGDIVKKIDEWDLATRIIRETVSKFLGKLTPIIKTIGFVIGVVEEITDVTANWEGAVDKVKLAWVKFKISAGQVWIDIKNRISNIWDGIKSNFTSPFSVAGGLFSGVTNAFTEAINKIIRAWNSLTFTMPEVRAFGRVVAEARSFSVPRIPEVRGFATGGVHEPNNPFLAILGDHKTQREVTAPEDMLREVFRDELSQGGMGQGLTVNIGEINASDMDAQDLAEEIWWRARIGGQ